VKSRRIGKGETLALVDYFSAGEKMDTLHPAISGRPLLAKSGIIALGLA
jgi:hypothetical protein